MTDFNVLVDVGRVDPDSIDLDALADWHAIAAGTPSGTIELVLTVPAEHLRQAVATALTIVATAGHEPQAVRAMTTDAYDTGVGLGPEPETLSVAEAAELLHVTPQAIRQRLTTGTLPGRRIGRDWRLPTAAIEQLHAGLHRDLTQDDVDEIAAAKTRRHKTTAAAR